MKGFGIEIKNNLLDPKHVKNMGNAVWLYMYLVDKVTSIGEDGIGRVLGGKPLKFDDVKKELGISQDTYTNWINKLLEYPYILTIRTPYGISFKVLKAHKRFREKTESIDSAKDTNLFGKKTESNKTDQKTRSEDISSEPRNEDSDFTSKSKTDTEEKNVSTLKGVLEGKKLLNEKLKYPEDGPFDYRYILNQGKGVSVPKYMLATCWKELGEYPGQNYSFSTKGMASGMIKRDLRAAKELSAMVEFKDIKRLVELVDEKFSEMFKKGYELRINNLIKYAYLIDQPND